MTDNHCSHSWVRELYSESEFSHFKSVRVKTSSRSVVFLDSGVISLHKLVAMLQATLSFFRVFIEYNTNRNNSESAKWRKREPTLCESILDQGKRNPRTMSYFNS